MKKFLCFALSLVVVFGLVPSSVFTANAGSADFRGVSIDYGEASLNEAEGAQIITYRNDTDTLTLSADVIADLLIVGGGGSGSSGGSSSSAKVGYGGKGGEVVECSQIRLNKGEYVITVGKGGDPVKATGTTRMIGRAGSPSSFSSGDGTLKFSANGGAAGADDDNTFAGDKSKITGSEKIYGKDGSKKQSGTTGTKGNDYTGNGGGGGCNKGLSGAGGSGVVIIRIYSHPHSISYGVDPTDDTVITATCENAIGCELESALKIKLGADGYFDSTQLENWVKSGADAPVVRYYSSDDLVNSILGEPCEPGDYVAKATVGSGSNTAEVQVAFSLTGHSHYTGESWKTFSAWNESASLPAAGSYYLTADVKLNTNVTVTRTLNICLNGHVIDLNGKLFDVNGGTFNLYDCGETPHYFEDFTETNGVKHLKLQAEKNDDTVYTVFGGVITGGAQSYTNSAANGGAIKVTNGEFNLYDGYVVGNYCYTKTTSEFSSGGAVYLSESSFKMFGGGLIGNSAKADYSKSYGSGGAVYIAKGGSAFVYGGIISLNTASHHGGGVYAANGILTVGGTAYIRDNHSLFADYLNNGDKENNLMTQSSTGTNDYNPGVYVKIDNVLYPPREGMDVGVRRANITSDISQNVEDYSTYFVSDNFGLYIIYVAESRAIKLGLLDAYTHRVGLNTIGEGYLYSDLQAAKAGEKVKLTPIPADGYMISGLSYTTASNTSPVELDPVNGQYSLIMPNEEVYVTAEFIPVFEFKSKNLALDSALAFRFKGVLNDPTVADDAYVEFTVGDTGNKQIAKLSEAEVDESGRYVLTCYLNALEVNEKISAVFRYGAGGEKSYTRKNPLSLDDYLDQVMELHAGSNKDVDVATCELVNAIYNYTYEVQAALDADDDYEDAVSAEYITELIDSSVLDELRPDVQVQDGYTKTTVSYGLALDDKTAIELFLRAEAGHTPVVNVNGESVTPSLLDEANNIYSVVIPDIMAHQLKKTFTVDVDNGGISIENLSALSYAVSVFDTEELAGYKMALSAMYEYCEKTIAYRDLVIGG